MSRDRIRRGRRICAVAAWLALAAAPTAAHADTVATLLGNFTISQFCGLHLADDAVNVRYTVVYGQLPALRELHAADADGDGVTSQAERDAYVARLAPAYASELKLVVDGVPVPFEVDRLATSLPTEQGGFSLRLDVDLSARLPATVARGEHTLAFANHNFAGRFGWQEIVVEAPPSINVYATDAFSTSLTAGLAEAVAVMPSAGPPAERAVSMSFTRGRPPGGAQLLQPRPGTRPAAAAAAGEVMPPAAAAPDASWLVLQTRRLIDLISTPDIAPHVALFALLAAMLLGALHALSPGHGKTVVGAYLIGSRATPRHALFLGATVTVTHTLGVFALGFATMFASRYIVPERLLPILSLVSGLLVLGMGILLLARRWRGMRDALVRRPGARDASTAATRGALAFRQASAAMQMRQSRRVLAMAFAAGPPHHHGDHHHYGESDGHDHRAHGHDGTAMHSHGGRMHSHLPPGAAGEAVTWRSLLALGISGGLVPCPSAMVLLLAAVALDKTAFGLLLVLAFSTGLALSLTAIGFAFLHARDRIPRAMAGARWPQLVPVASAAAITLVGALLCYGAIFGGGF